MSKGSLADSDITAIRERSATFQRLAVANDWDAWIELVADNAVYLPPNESAVVGRAAVREWVDAFPHVDEMTLTINDVIGEGDLAVVRGSFAMTVTGDDGVSVADHGKYIEVWGRQSDGAWRLVRDIWNSGRPATP